MYLLCCLPISSSGSARQTFPRKRNPNQPKVKSSTSSSPESPSSTKVIPQPSRTPSPTSATSNKSLAAAAPGPIADAAATTRSKTPGAQHQQRDAPSAASQQQQQQHHHDGQIVHRRDDAASQRNARTPRTRSRSRTSGQDAAARSALEAKPAGAEAADSPSRRAQEAGEPTRMPGKTPHSNGNEPVENGIRSNQDVEMKDDASSLKTKGKKTKDGDDEMTVVVPPSKKQPNNPPPQPDADGDVAMGESEAVDGGEVKADPVAQTVSDIKSNFALLDRAVTLFDARFTLRALRSISLIRKRLSADIIAHVIADTFPAAGPSTAMANQLLIAVGREHVPLGRPFGSPEMEIDSEPRAAAATAGKGSGGGRKEPKDVIPEIDIFIAILIQVHLLDTKQFQRGSDFSSYLSERIQSLNRRTLDSLSAKVYFYYMLFCEQLAPLAPSPQSPVVAIRPTLLAALRTAVLRKDVDTQASVIVLLLRNYLLTSQIGQADLLVSHTQFPETAANNQVARFLYYLGRIRAIQLRYTEAHEHLTAATRKAPSSSCAVGFSQTATKLLLVVELLMGDIPDRATFRQPTLEMSLNPYFLLVQAVRVGNLESFEDIIGNNAGTFRRDGTYTLILRLRQNVIKTGIRMMSLSYSRISLRDICIRLHLGSEESAEYIVAKAIRDGVIEATLDREHGFMKSKEIGDVYATREPGEAFHDRIRACLALHDESVKAMRFPMNQHRLELKNAQQAQEREREMAKEIQDGELDEDDLGGDFDGM